ncbi:MAG: hypothetical protein WAL63_11590 [Solirubrobacteraceae bacterium]
MSLRRVTVLLSIAGFAAADPGSAAARALAAAGHSAAKTTARGDASPVLVLVVVLFVAALAGAGVHRLAWLDRRQAPRRQPPPGGLLAPATARSARRVEPEAGATIAPGRGRGPARRR